MAVAGVVTRLAEGYGTSACPAGDPLGPAGDCAGLVASLALRVGVAAGLAAVLMGLVSVGLHLTAIRRGEASGPDEDEGET